MFKTRQILLTIHFILLKDLGIRILIILDADLNIINADMQRWIALISSSVADPDPHVFGPGMDPAPDPSIIMQK